MRRNPSLRQIEAFKAVIEYGTISRAAAALHVSQPAMSKMIASLEWDADLTLFDRVKGRLAPTQRGMRLYDEIDRIFAGVQQVANAIDVIKREDQGRIAIGAMPALSGTFIQQVTTAFLKRHPQVFCFVESRSSTRLMEWLVTRKLDVALIEAGVHNPYVLSEPLMEHPLVCIMPADHALVAKSLVELADLDGLPFVSFTPGITVVDQLLEEQRARPNVVLVASMASTVCAFVAAGHGVSLVHPAFARVFGKGLVVRPFEPAIPRHFQICRRTDNRNARLVADFVETAHEVGRDTLTVDGIPEAS